MHSTRDIKKSKQKSPLKEPSWLWKAAPGGFLAPEARYWRMGEWSAKPDGVCFFQNKVKIHSFSYSDIRGLAIKDISYGFGVKPCLEIIFGDETKQKIRLITADVKAWERFFRVRAFPGPLTEDQITLIASKVDSFSEQILWYFWKKHRASIADLMRLGLMEDPREILAKIKDNINIRSLDLLGFPLLIFREKQTDPGTFKEIPNCWWLIDPVIDSAVID